MRRRHWVRSVLASVVGFSITPAVFLCLHVQIVTVCFYHLHALTFLLLLHRQDDIYVVVDNAVDEMRDRILQQGEFVGSNSLMVYCDSIPIYTFASGISTYHPVIYPHVPCLLLVLRPSSRIPCP